MDFGALPPEINLRRLYTGPGCGSTLAAAAACDTALAVAERLALAAFSGVHAHVDVNPEPVRPLGPTQMAVHPVACRSAQYRRCTHPGELGRWVMTTHPASVNAGSTAGERRVSAADDVPDLHSRPRDRAAGVRIRRDAP
jgi:hypothetical protein